MSNLPVPTQDTYTVGQILTSGSMNKNVRDGVNFAINPPVFKGLQGSGQSLSSGFLFAVSFDTTSIDSYSGHSNSTNNSRYTAQVAGVYRITGKVALPVNGTTGRRYATINLNGGELSDARNEAFPFNNSQGAVTQNLFVETIQLMNTGDFVEIVATQTSGSSMTLVTSPTQSSMTVEWVHT
jgi:hypothetical protein